MQSGHSLMASLALGIGALHSTTSLRRTSWWAVAGSMCARRHEGATMRKHECEIALGGLPRPVALRHVLGTSGSPRNVQRAGPGRFRVRQGMSDVLLARAGAALFAPGGCLTV